MLFSYTAEDSSARCHASLSSEYLRRDPDILNDFSLSSGISWVEKNADFH